MGEINKMNKLKSLSKSISKSLNSKITSYMNDSGQ